MGTIVSKTCSACDVELPVSEFYPDKQNRDGLKGRCRSCCNGRVPSRRRHYRRPTDRVVGDDVLRTCNSCGIEKPIVHFHKNPTAPTGRRRECRECIDVRNRTRLFAGFSHEDYVAMVAAQRDLCAICKLPEDRAGRDGEPRSLCIDHDHITGAVRALLCHRCNVAVGLFRENVEAMANAIAYLKFHGSA